MLGELATLLWLWALVSTEFCLVRAASDGIAGLESRLPLDDNMSVHDFLSVLTGTERLIREGFDDLRLVLSPAVLVFLVTGMAVRPQTYS